MGTGVEVTWKELVMGYEDLWNLPHAIGAIDGKHIRIKNHLHADSHYFFVFLFLDGPMSSDVTGV